MHPVNVPAKFEVRSFIRSRDNIDGSYGWGLRTPILGKRRPLRVEDGTVRKSFGKFLYTLYSNFFSSFTRFRDIAAFVLHAARHFSHPTSSLPKISPCFPGSR